MAGPLTNAAVTTIGGLFTVVLDFGATVFDGTSYWLEVGVRTNGGGTFTTLSPRQPLLMVPYAAYASSANKAQTANNVSASSITGQLTLGQLPEQVMTNGQVVALADSAMALAGVPAILSIHGGLPLAIIPGLAKMCGSIISMI